MAISSTHNLIKLFSNEEYDDLYGLPHFSGEERVLFFALSLHDKKFVDSFRKIQDKIYCLLSLGYFRAKQSLINFNVNLIIADRRYLIETYYPTQKTPRTLPSQSKKIRIQNKILAHEKSIRLNKNIKENINTQLSQLIKRHPKARPLTKSLLHHLSKQRIALPAYSTLQRLITKALSDEQDRIYYICQKILSRP